MQLGEAVVEELEAEQFAESSYLHTEPRQADSCGPQTCCRHDRLGGLHWLMFVRMHETALSMRELACGHPWPEHVTTHE